MIYPDPVRDRWRHSVVDDRGGILCGALDVRAEAPEADARAVAERMLARVGSEWHGVRFAVAWRPLGKPGWWGGDITSARRTPEATT
jgi:hypothetical protein